MPSIIINNNWLNGNDSYYQLKLSGAQLKRPVSRMWVRNTIKTNREEESANEGCTMPKRLNSAIQWNLDTSSWSGTWRIFNYNSALDTGCTWIFEAGLAQCEVGSRPQYTTAVFSIEGCTVLLTATCNDIAFAVAGWASRKWVRTSHWSATSTLKSLVWIAGVFGFYDILTPRVLFCYY